MSIRYQIRGENAKQIAESLELAIDAGRLRAGERLPTIRALAGQLGVSPTTVNAAYAALRAHGRLSGNRRGGSVILGRPVFQSARVAAAPAAGRDLAVANPDAAFLPSPAAALAVAGHGPPRLYGAPDGGRLTDAARRWFARDGILADHVAVAGGAMDGIGLALVSHVAPGDVVALEDPTYPPYRELARALQLRVVPVAIDERGPLPESLAAALRGRARAFVTIPRGHNPTGASIDAKRRTALRRVLDAAPDVLVVEDDYLSEVSGAPLSSLGGRNRWIVVRSVAKILGPDLRVAVLAGDPLTVSRVRERQRIGVGWVSTILQDVVAALLSDPATDRLFAAARRTYTQRRTGLLRALQQHGIPGAGGSGLTVWIPVAEETATVRGLLARGWIVDAGERYRAAGKPAIRVCIATLTPAESARFAADLAMVLRGGGEPGLP